MTTITDDQIIRCRVVIRQPCRIEYLPPLAVFYRIVSSKGWGFLRSTVRRLFDLALAAGAKGTGRMLIGQKSLTFDARHLAYGSLYLKEIHPNFGPETAAVLDRLVYESDAVLDVGANWGWHALLLISRPTFKGTVYAVESAPETFGDLTQMVGQLGLEERIVCLNDLNMALTQPSPTLIKINAEDQDLKILQDLSPVIDQSRPFIVFGNWRHADDSELTQAPLELLDRKKYRFFFPGWSLSPHDYPQPHRGAATLLALVPFLPAQRFLLPAQMTVVAVPEERLDEFRARFHK